jgi:hypothetical protein
MYPPTTAAGSPAAASAASTSAGSCGPGSNSTHATACAGYGPHSSGSR